MLINERAKHLFMTLAQKASDDVTTSSPNDPPNEVRVLPSSGPGQAKLEVLID